MKSLREQMREFKRAVVLRAIAESGGNFSEAARKLEVHRNHIDFMLEDLNIDATQLRKSKKLAEVMSAMAISNLEITNRYANSYCKGTIPGGPTGQITCNQRIPISERYCEECKKSIELRIKKTATGSQ